MIGVAIPAHDEAERIGACIASVQAAAGHPALGGERVHIVVVADACTDSTAWQCQAAGIDAIIASVRNVGAARALAADALLRRGARWLAFTDADSRVPVDWLAAQVGCGHDAFCGVVDLMMEADEVGHLLEGFRATERWGDGHGRIHGANMGVSAAAYRRAGGFPPLTCHEDVALVERLRWNGASIHWAGSPRVLTSARLEGRAPGGFAAHLRSLGNSLHEHMDGAAGAGAVPA